MTSHDLIEAAAELLNRFSRPATEQDPKVVWQEVLAWLVQKTNAAGGWLRLPTPASLTVTQGALDKASLTHLASWTSEVELTRDSEAEIRQVADLRLLCMVTRNDNLQPTALVALGFAVNEMPTEEAGAHLQAALQALSTIMRQASALENTQLRLSRFQHLYEVGQAISSTLDLDQVLKQSTERVTEVLRAEASTLILINEATRELVFKIPAGPAEAILREQRMPIDKGIAGWVATHGEPIIISDVTSDNRFYIQIDHMSGFRTRSIMAIPLQVKGKTIGVIEVINKVGGGSFTADDEQWLSILSPLIAAAIDNARLFSALRDEHDRIILAEEQVRHELARDLHDGPAQILAALILNIDMARRQLAIGPEKMATELNFLDSLAQQANQEVRDLLFGLRPLALESHGLTTALTQLAERQGSHSKYKIHLDVMDVADKMIDPRVANTLFVIAQEALNNVQKHADARNVWLKLKSSAEVLWVEVSDDGVGFNVPLVDASYSQRGSFGLLNMRERARLIDARTTIVSPPPGAATGAQVRVEVPMERARRVI